MQERTEWNSARDEQGRSQDGCWAADLKTCSRLEREGRGPEEELHELYWEFGGTQNVCGEGRACENIRAHLPLHSVGNAKKALHMCCFSVKTQGVGKEQLEELQVFASEDET